MKNILCYGDSNVFGYNPIDGSRFDNNSRWTGVLQTILKNEFEIIEEGINNRTGFVKNPDNFLYSAQRHFPKLISKSQFFDIIILAIGTNDLQIQYDINFRTIEKGLEALILTAKNKSNDIILIPPVNIDKSILNGNFKNLFDESSISKSKKVKKTYKKLAQVFNCKYFDFNKVTTPSQIDGLHYDVNAHQLIAKNLAEFIRKECING